SPGQCLKSKKRFFSEVSASFSLSLSLFGHCFTFTLTFRKKVMYPIAIAKKGARMISNLLFMPMLKGILLFFLSLFVWWNLTFLTKKDKRLVASFSGDAAFAFLSFAFSFQLFFHWKDILTSPSYFFLLSARPTGIALICTAGYLGYKKISRLFDQPLFYQGWFQLLVTGTTVNHLYYAFMYGQLRSILSAGLGLAALFF